MDLVTQVLAAIAAVEAWALAHPVATLAILWVVSSVLSAVPPAWAPWGVPVGAAIHVVFGNVGHVVRKIAERVPSLAWVLALIPGTSAPPERRP